jgi:hypothetical protein
VAARGWVSEDHVPSRVDTGGDKFHPCEGTDPS